MGQNQRTKEKDLDDVIQINADLMKYEVDILLAMMTDRVKFPNELLLKKLSLPKQYGVISLLDQP